MEQGHPNFGIAAILLVLTAQTGLYNLYLRRPQRALMMCGALILAVAMVFAVPSTVTLMLTVVVFLGLSALVFRDLLKLKDIVAAAAPTGGV